jgi:hypothetical protein
MSDTRPARTADDATATSEERLRPTLELAFARLHKAAFGVATGAATAVIMAVLTVMVMLWPPANSFPLHLMREYFAGYTVSWIGMLVGSAWAFGVGFVAGWFVAFCRNLSLAITLFTIRTRAEIEQTRTFLDHI